MKQSMTLRGVADGRHLGGPGGTIDDGGVRINHES